MAYGDRTCTVEGCEKPLRARGCCDYHYHRLTVYGAVNATTALEQRRPWLKDDGVIDEVAVERVVTGWGTGTQLTSQEVDEVVSRMLDMEFGSTAIAESIGCEESLIAHRIFKAQRQKADPYGLRVVVCGCASVGGAAAGCCLARDLALRPRGVCQPCFAEYQQGHNVYHVSCEQVLPGVAQSDVA